MANKLVKAATTNAWDAGAVSASSRPGNLAASFTLVAGSAGIVAGLAPASSNPSYASVEHGFLAQAGAPIRIIESGVIVASTGIVFTTDTPVQIYRAASVVYYVVGNFSFTSAKPSTGSKALQAVFYSPGDSINSPTITDYAQDITNASGGSTITLSDGGGFERFVYAGAGSDLTLSGSGAGRVILLAGAGSTLVLLDGVGASITIVAGVGSALRLSSGGSVGGIKTLQYATNLLTGAATRYEGFGFDGFCRVGMDTYGFKSDGLYKIGGGDDSGAPINMLIDFAADEFGTPQGKRVGNVFLGLETDGDVFVRMTDDDDREANYRAYQRRSEFRADMGRGGKSRFWRLRLEVLDSTEARLDNFEWVVSTTGRRT
jgi:hypothetical protein